MPDDCEWRWSPGVPEPRSTSGEVHVWRFRLDVADPGVTQFRALLDPDEIARSEKYHFERDRRRFIVARAQLRILLGRYLSTAAAALRFRYGSTGKPELAAAPHSTIPRFSVSHSDGLCVVAVSMRTVGVDIERNRALGPADSFIGALAPGELAALRALPEPLRQDALFACWTRKEAYLKAIGAGLGFGLDRFEVSVDPGRAALLRVDNRPGEESRWVLRQLHAAPGYSGALVVEGADWRLRCWDLER